MEKLILIQNNKKFHIANTNHPMYTLGVYVTKNPKDFENLIDTELTNKQLGPGTLIAILKFSGGEPMLVTTEPGGLYSEIFKEPIVTVPSDI